MADPAIIPKITRTLVDDKEVTALVERLEKFEVYEAHMRFYNMEGREAEPKIFTFVTYNEFTQEFAEYLRGHRETFVTYGNIDSSMRLLATLKSYGFRDLDLEAFGFLPIIEKESPSQVPKFCKEYTGGYIEPVENFSHVYYCDVFENIKSRRKKQIAWNIFISHSSNCNRLYNSPTSVLIPEHNGSCIRYGKGLDVRHMESQEYMEKFHIFTMNIFRRMTDNPCDFTVTGGLLAYLWHEDFPDTDVDILVEPKNVKTLVDFISEKLGDRLESVSTQNGRIVNMTARRPTQPQSVIFQIIPDEVETIGDYDMSHCQTFIPFFQKGRNPEKCKLWGSPHAIADIISNSTTILRTNVKSYRIRKIMKYRRNLSILGPVYLERTQTVLVPTSEYREFPEYASVTRFVSAIRSGPEKLPQPQVPGLLDPDRTEWGKYWGTSTMLRLNLNCRAIHMPTISKIWVPDVITLDRNNFEDTVAGWTLTSETVEKLNNFLPPGWNSRVAYSERPTGIIEIHISIFETMRHIVESETYHVTVFSASDGYYRILYDGHDVPGVKFSIKN